MRKQRKKLNKATDLLMVAIADFAMATLEQQAIDYEEDVEDQEWEHEDLSDVMNDLTETLINELPGVLDRRGVPHNI